MECSALYRRRGHSLPSRPPRQGAIAGYLSNPAPEYPEVALDRGWEGVVMLRVKVSPAGSPLEINLKNSSGKKALDDAAVKTVKRWKFSPALRGNTPVEGWVDVPIHFKLPN